MSGNAINKDVKGTCYGDKEDGSQQVKCESQPRLVSQKSVQLNSNQKSTGKSFSCSMCKKTFAKHNNFS